MSHIHQLATQMADAGVRHVFGIPGSGASLTLLDCLAHKDVAFHLTHFEGTAALIAGAMGRQGDGLAVALTIKGPGLANLVPGLAACHLDAMPLVSIAEAYPPQAPAHKAHKRLDHEALTAGVCKGRRYCSDHPEQFRELAAWAREEVPGPVHLDLCPQPMENESTPAPRQTAAEQPLPPDFLRLLEQARRPVVIAGSLALRLGLSPRLNDLKLPVFSTAAAKGVVNEHLAHAAGVYTGAGDALAPETRLLPQCDLIVGIGLRYNEILGHSLPQTALHIDPLGLEPGNALGFAACAVPDAAVRDELFEQLGHKQWGLDEVHDCTRTLRESLLKKPFLPALALAQTEEHFQGQACLVLDTGNFCTIAEHIWRVPRPELYCASGQGRYMGVSLPLGLGCALNDSSLPTVVFTGDGGLGMYLAEVKLAVAHKLPLLIVLFSDGHLGTVRGAALARGLEQQPTRIQQPSWRKALEGLGVPAAAPQNEQELASALDAWDLRSPMFIEVSFDPDAYQAMTAGLRKG